MVLFLMTHKSTRPLSLPFLNTFLLIFMVTPVEFIIRAMYFVSVRGNSFLINSGRCCFFSSLSEECTLGSVCSWYGILYRLGYTELVSVVTMLNIRYKFRCADMLFSLEANLLKCLCSLVWPNNSGKDLQIYSFALCILKLCLSMVKFIKLTNKQLCSCPSFASVDILSM